MNLRACVKCWEHPCECPDGPQAMALKAAEARGREAGKLEERARCERIVLNVYNASAMGFAMFNSILRVMRSGEVVEAGEHEK